MQQGDFSAGAIGADYAAGISLGNASFSPAWTRRVLHETHQEAEAYCQDHPAAMPLGVQGKFRYSIKDGSVYEYHHARVLACVVARLVALKDGKHQTITEYRAACGKRVEVMYRYRDLRKEIGEGEKDFGVWTDSMIEMLEWVTSPLDKLKESMMSLAHLDELAEAQERVKEMKALYEKTKAARDAYVKSHVDDAVNRALRNELASINEQTAAMDRQLSTLRARRELMETKAQIADKAALAGGEDPAVVAINEIVRQQVARADEVNDAVTRAEGALSAAETELNVTVKKLFDLQERGGTRGFPT